MFQYSSTVVFSECIYTFENVGRGNQPQGGVEIPALLASKYNIASCTLLLLMPCMYVSRTQYGLTPLMMATKNGKMAAANVLLEAGADVNLQSNDVRRKSSD